MPNCKNCKIRYYRLRCLACEQADELEKTKHIDIEYSQIVSFVSGVFPQLNLKERAVWVLYLADFTEKEISKISHIDQAMISRYITRIRDTLKS